NLLPLVAHPRIVRKRGTSTMRTAQRRQQEVRPLGIPGFAGLGECAYDALASRNALPREIDSLEQVVRRTVAEPYFEVVREGSTALRGAEAMALVHAPALARDLGVRTAEQRVVDAKIQRDASGCRIGPRGRRPEGIPHEPLGTPHLHSVELLRKSGGIGCRLEGFLGQDRRSGVMTMATDRRR